MNHIAEQSTKHLGRILRLLRRKTSHQPDEYDHDALFVELEQLLALEAAGLVSVLVVPSAEELERLLSRWLAGWEACIGELSPVEGFTAARRAVIERTFARLVALCDAARR